MKAILLNERKPSLEKKIDKLEFKFSVDRHGLNSVGSVAQFTLHELIFWKFFNGVIAASSICAFIGFE